jgi:hypothetical protein
MVGAILACARESNPAGAAGTSGRALLQLLGFAVNVGVEQAGGQWTEVKTSALFLELTSHTGLVCLNRRASWESRAGPER